MALESTRKSCAKKAIMAIVFFVCVTMLCGCDLPFKQYPHEKASYWSCDDPKIILNYSKDDQDNWILSEQIHLDSETIEVSVAMRGNIYCVYPDDSAYYSDRLFRGKWKYRKGNLVLIIEEDFLFDGQYDEIILVPQEKP